MKRTVLAVATLAATAAANAQSSVTIFGIVDVAITYGTASGTGAASRLQLTNSGYNSSRLGFRGTEDLGGGMSASFWLESGVNNDNGTGQATNTNNQATGGAVAGIGGGQGLTFNRRSTVSLAGSMGELRLGRDYTPQYWNIGLFDPLGNLGVGASQTLNSIITGSTAVRSSNGISYFLPATLGGIYGQVSHYLGENSRTGAATDKDGTGTGVRLGYASGPFNVAVAVSRTKYAAGDVKQDNIAGQWDFGVAKLLAQVSWDESGTTKARGWVAGALIPVGPGEVRVGYSRYRIDLASTNVDPSTGKIAVSYVHNLSKRTALYATAAQLSNKNGSSQTLGGTVAGGPNQKSTGFDFGLRHAF